jgi:hypothetical protein
MGGWMGRWMNGWLEGWVGRWVDGWMDGQIDSHSVRLGLNKYIIQRINYFSFESGRALRV